MSLIRLFANRISIIGPWLDLATLESFQYPLQLGPVAHHFKASWIHSEAWGLHLNLDGQSFSRPPINDVLTLSLRFPNCVFFLCFANPDLMVSQPAPFSNPIMLPKDPAVGWCAFHQGLLLQNPTPLFTKSLAESSFPDGVLDILGEAALPVFQAYHQSQDRFISSQAIKSILDDATQALQNSLLTRPDCVLMASHCFATPVIIHFSKLDALTFIESILPQLRTIAKASDLSLLDIAALLDEPRLLFYAGLRLMHKELNSHPTFLEASLSSILESFDRQPPPSPCELSNSFDVSLLHQELLKVLPLSWARALTHSPLISRLNALNQSIPHHDFVFLTHAVHPDSTGCSMDSSNAHCLSFVHRLIFSLIDSFDGSSHLKIQRLEWQKELLQSDLHINLLLEKIDVLLQAPIDQLSLLHTSDFLDFVSPLLARPKASIPLVRFLQTQLSQSKSRPFLKVDPLLSYFRRLFSFVDPTVLPQLYVLAHNADFSAVLPALDQLMLSQSIPQALSNTEKLTRL